LCLQVDLVVDILEVDLEIKRASESELFIGTAVIQEQATEVVDVFEVLKRADPHWFTKTKASAADGQKPKILFVEDAPFFRNLVIPVLEAMDFEIWTAADGVEACDILANKVPDLILTDIEMPNMNGYELADWVRTQSRLKGIPVVALTGSAPDESDSKSDAFSDVLMKFDRPSLMEHLKQAMGDRGHDKAMSVDAQLVAGAAITDK
ncbi:MAG: response regulator, partial [Mariprofundaceae bacterium]